MANNQLCLRQGDAGKGQSMSLCPNLRQALDLRERAHNGKALVEPGNSLAAALQAECCWQVCQMNGWWGGRNDSAIGAPG